MSWNFHRLHSTVNKILYIYLAKHNTYKPIQFFPNKCWKWDRDRENEWSHVVICILNKQAKACIVYCCCCCCHYYSNIYILVITIIYANIAYCVRLYIVFCVVVHDCMNIHKLNIISIGDNGLQSFTICILLLLSWLFSWLCISAQILVNYQFRQCLSRLWLYVTFKIVLKTKMTNGQIFELTKNICFFWLKIVAAKHHDR